MDGGHSNLCYHPEQKIPRAHQWEFLAYGALIVKGARDYKGSAWLYAVLAAARGNLGDLVEMSVCETTSVSLSFFPVFTVYGANPRFGQLPVVNCVHSCELVVVS